MLFTKSNLIPPEIIKIISKSDSSKVVSSIKESLTDELRDFYEEMSEKTKILFKILMPNVNTMCYDHVRSRLWWITDSKIYVADTRNYQVQTMNVAKYNFNSIKIDFSSGNAFAIGTDIHSDKYLIQIFRDNNKILGVAYVL